MLKTQFFLYFILVYLSASSQSNYNLKLDTMRGWIEYKKSEEAFKKISENYDGSYKKEFQKTMKEIMPELKPIYKNIYYNEEFNNYIGQILNMIKAKNSDLNDKEIRYYFLYEESPNAFMVLDGSMFIGLGLFDILENESQLAMVLSHELSHYSQSHGYNRLKRQVEYENSSEMQQKINSAKVEGLNRIERVQNLLKAYNFNVKQHSRENESEADSVAAEYLMNTPYALDEAILGIKVLKKADTEYFEINSILKDVFSFENSPFKDNWIKKSTSIGEKLRYKLTPEQKDSISTHPNTDLRYEELNKLIQGKETRDILEISNETFEKIKKDFRVELVNYLVSRKQLSTALYYILKYQNEGDERLELKQRLYETLDLMETALDNHTLGKYVDIRNPYFPPQYNNLLIFIDNLTVDDFKEIKNNYKSKFNL